MTFREKFHEEFPKRKGFNPASKWCPSSFDYEADWTCGPADCSIMDCGSGGFDCDECWDREIPDQRPDPYFNIEIEQIRQSSNWKQDDVRALEYLERLFNFKENESRCTIEVTSEGLDREERAILFDAMERALRRIRHRQIRDDRPDIQCQAVLK